MRCDVVVMGAGLAGLVAANDLSAAGADVVVLEARGRAGGRVYQQTLLDGRQVQLGGEVIGPHHVAYRELVTELGLTMEPSFTQVPGRDTFVLSDGRRLADSFDWLSEADQELYRRCDEEFGRLARTIDPDDPWSHPDARALDAISVADWLRSQGATPDVLRARRLAMLALAAEPPEHTSLLADLRKEATAPEPRFYDYLTWESLRVAEGSGTVVERLAAALTRRIRFESPVAHVRVSAKGCVVRTRTGEVFESEAVVSALPAGPLRDINIQGVSEARLASLHVQHHARASKVVYVFADSFWERAHQNGAAYFEDGLIGGTWSQRDGILSALVPPGRSAQFDATPAARIQVELLSELERAFGRPSAAPDQIFIKRWGTDPWTQGYITAWRPGDVMRVGPLHATHEPPFYVCGSDQWVCGYMEGAVRTGRSAAAAAISRGQQAR